MRPAKTSQGNLAAPLNRILGTEANVRLLRVLADAEEPLSRPEAARRAQMDASGIRRALDALVAEGIVEPVGSGARPPVRLRDAHPLAPALRQLFAAEQRRADEVIHVVREIVGALEIQPRAVWMSTLVPEADTLEIVRVGVLAGARVVDAVARALSDGLRETQRRLDVMIEIRPYTIADLQTLSVPSRAELSASMPILGPAPTSFIDTEAPAAAPLASAERGHARQDRRGLLLGRAIGERIMRDPSLIRRAREYARRMAASSPGVRREMEEWEMLLETLSPARLRAFLAHPGERATRLRQSLPFIDVLTADEREHLFRKAGA
ncbi:helix-turn-helix domain-containing protein [Longimicrobium sp.]|uniref:helix-turn-helix domain-containing protein n=1 Tax=Longimicrobium sp. TaxID=2029185 RepID=UPI002E2FA5EE|nr:helix-turn-helix domain-containing protein [Longimicrobium sp.]HEX6038579.1 helix-turn-helix domain-containing protein [Longimicrobium sp.]